MININKYKQISYDDRRTLYLIMLKLDRNGGDATKEDILRLTKIYTNAYSNQIIPEEIEDITFIYNVCKELNKIYVMNEVKTKPIKINKEYNRGNTKFKTNGVYNDYIECMLCLELRKFEEFYLNKQKCIIRSCKICLSEKRSVSVDRRRKENRV